MRIVSLRLKHFTGIKRGLSLDEITIDFSTVAGLVAFDGANGVGKSSVIESLSPYNRLASRDGALYRHCCSRNAEKELVFTYAGHHYRTLIKIDAESEKTEGYIWKDGKPEVNGKISAYSKYIAELFGTADLFYSSVFCAQNSAKLSELTTGKLKELFSEFLRLDRLVEYENTAKQCANVMNGKVSQVEARIEALREKVKGKDELSATVALTENHLQLTAEKKSILMSGMVDLRSRIDNLKETVSRNGAIRQRKADVAAIIDSMTKEMGAEKDAVEAEIESLKDKYREMNAEASKYDAIIAVRDAITTAVDREREVNDSIATMAPESDRLTDEIAKHQETAHKLERTIQDLKQAARDLEKDEEIRKCDSIAETINGKITELNRLVKDLDNDREAHSLTTAINQCREKMTTLDLKDPACVSTTCSFILGALQARDSMPGLEAKLTERNAFVDQAKQEKAAMIQTLQEGLARNAAERSNRAIFIKNEQQRIAEDVSTNDRRLKAERLLITTKTDAVSTIRQNIARARLDLSKLKDLAAKQTDLQVALSRRADLDVRLQEITETGKTTRAAWTEKELAKKTQIDEQAAKMAAIDSEIDQGADANLSTAISTMEAMEKQIPDLDLEVTKTRDKVSQAQGELTRMAEAEKEIEAVRDERDLLLRNAAEWTYLRNACSKNGLQALEIDGAAPIITGYANELLSMAFGPLFTVKFRTQDEEGREVLDIVTIGEDGEEVLLENLSGGQRIWILMALRLAMTLLSKEKSGRAYESFFADEIDGPLDPENSINFVNMYQAFMKIGGFKAGYFISHKPSCRALAENVLKFEAGKNPVWG